MIKENLFGKTKLQIENICKNLSLPKYTSSQITDWLYKKHCNNIDEMSNISKDSKEKLKEICTIYHNAPTHIESSVDGTNKYLFPVSDKKYIESVYIPDDDRSTLCVSSQVGCKMGCAFCMTGKQGFKADLSSSEILNQISSLPERDRLSNIVYMGMGEPFDNLDAVLTSLEILTSDWGFAMSPKRITLSTIGVIPGIKRFLNESKCHLAISLHSPFEEERKNLMPIENKYSIKDIIAELKEYDFSHQRRLSFEYILLKGINDSLRHAKALVNLLKGLDCRVNLIRYHTVPGLEFYSSDKNSIQIFMAELRRKGVISTLRSSRGEDIMAACGLLTTKEMQ